MNLESREDLCKKDLGSPSCKTKHALCGQETCVTLSMSRKAFHDSGHTWLIKNMVTAFYVFKVGK